MTTRTLKRMERDATDKKVMQSIMWLCAQPPVAKHIRKLWHSPLHTLAAHAQRKGAKRKGRR